MMALAAELLILIGLFTLVCVLLTNNVEKHPDWAVLNYPPAVVERLIAQGRVQVSQPPPLGGRVKKKMPVIIIFIFLLAAIVRYVNGCRTFQSAFGTCMLIWTVVDWYDALVLDCLWFCHSKKVRVPGTEDMDEAYGDYMFHIKGSARGMILGLIVSLLVGLVVAVAAMLSL